MLNSQSKKCQVPVTCFLIDLVMTKQHAHCFVTVALVFLQSYFWDRRQIVKTESNYIDWKTVAEGVPP